MKLNFNIIEDISSATVLFTSAIFISNIFSKLNLNKKDKYINNIYLGSLCTLGSIIIIKHISLNDR